ncbi:MAG: hypothetical protein ABIH09_02620 [Candidatus Omnitrophota bacterium]
MKHKRFEHRSIIERVPKRQASKGVVLVTVLWFITVLAIFGMGLGRVSWSVYNFARWRENKLAGEQAVRGIVLMLKLDRKDDLTPEYDSLTELAQEREYKFGNIKIVYYMIDEESKININEATSLILQNLPSMDMDKAVELVNSELKPFFPKEEILKVEDIEKEDYAEMKDFITVYGTGAVNMNTCSKEILEILDFDAGLIDSIMEFRAGEDEELYTEDDGIFDSTSYIITSLNECRSLSLTEEQAINSLISKKLLGVKGSFYTIHADVYVNDKLVDSYAVLIGKEETYSVYDWQ